MAKYSMGLKSLKMGEVGAAGGMGEDLADFGGTFKGTATLTQEDAQRTEFNIEEQIDPVVIASQPGKKTLAFTVINLEAQELARLMGGSVDGGGNCLAPRNIAAMERSIELITDFGSRVQIPRADITAKLNWNFSRTEIAKVEVTATILTPQKAGIAPIILGEAEEE